MAGVYISFPFCRQKCTYCNFASGVFSQQLERDYLSALQAEVSATQWSWEPETVYLGGGTPSALEPADFPRLLSAVPGRPWREATLEAAPGSLTPEKIACWRESGINRVSLGVQSFVDEELRRTGRKHTAETVFADVEMLRKGGIANISIDLIAGLPSQTLESWHASLDAIQRLAVPHVSVYMLEVDEDSRLGKELILGGSRYGAGQVPGEAEIVAFYEEAVDRLAQLGLARYEISNFARPGLESLHNLKYWRLEPYLGFGADAHSFDGQLRWQNVESAAAYVARWTAGTAQREAETPAILTEERFFVGLRLMEGITPTEEEWHRYREPIDRFVDCGLLDSRDGRLRLTRRGVLLSNEVFGEFITSCVSSI